MTSQIKSGVNKYKKRTKGEFNHIPITLTISRVKLREKKHGKREESQNTKMASLVPSMPHQRHHNEVITPVQHLNYKGFKNTSERKAEQADLTRMLIVNDHDENTIKIFNFVQHTPFSAYDMANGASINFHSMKTVMLCIKPTLHNGVIPTPLFFQGFLQQEMHLVEAKTRDIEAWLWECIQLAFALASAKDLGAILYRCKFWHLHMAQFTTPHMPLFFQFVHALSYERACRALWGSLGTFTTMDPLPTALFGPSHQVPSHIAPQFSSCLRRHFIKQKIKSNRICAVERAFQRTEVSQNAHCTRRDMSKNVD